MHALLPRLLVAFTVGTACATPLLAQDQRDAPAPWLALEATVFHEGQPVSVVVDRASREARLFELRPGRDPIRHPLIVLSPELVARLDAAMTKAKPAASEELGPTSDPAQIQALQRHLNELGYPLQDDGDYGDATERAVRRFQAAEDLPVTGRVDSETRGRMGFVPPQGKSAWTAGARSRAEPSRGSWTWSSRARCAEPSPSRPSSADACKTEAAPSRPATGPATRSRGSTPAGTRPWARSPALSSSSWCGQGPRRPWSPGFASRRCPTRSPSAWPSTAWST